MSQGVLEAQYVTSYVGRSGRRADEQFRVCGPSKSWTFQPGNSQAFNRYSYVYNNPLSYTDPSGFEVPCAESLSCALGAIYTIGSWAKKLFGGNKPQRFAKVPAPGCYNAPPGCWGNPAAGRTPGFNPALSEGVLGGGFGGALQWGVAEGDLVISDNVVIQWGLDFIILDSIRSGRDTYDAVRERRWGDAVFNASGLICDIAKGCKFLSKVPGVDKLGGWARRQITRAEVPSSVHRGVGANATHKVRRPGMSGHDAATDIPSWAKGEAPLLNENGRNFAKRMLDEKYGAGNYPTGPGSEFSKLKKFADRAFENPPGT